MSVDRVSLENYFAGITHCVIKARQASADTHDAPVGAHGCRCCRVRWRVCGRRACRRGCGHSTSCSAWRRCAAHGSCRFISDLPYSLDSGFTCLPAEPTLPRSAFRAKARLLIWAALNRSCVVWCVLMMVRRRRCWTWRGRHPVRSRVLSEPTCQLALPGVSCCVMFIRRRRCWTWRGLASW
jgi:hypothetical protein